MVELTEWEAEHLEVQRQKELRRQLETADILDLVELGYQVEEINLYQFRITHNSNPGYRVDLYPTNKKYHVLKPEHRGRYENAIEFIKNKFGKMATSTELKDDSPMPFGKYKGWKMEDVPAKYLLYLHSEGRYTKDVKAYILDNWDVLEKEADEQEKTR